MPRDLTLTSPDGHRSLTLQVTGDGHVVIDARTRAKHIGFVLTADQQTQAQEFLRDVSRDRAA